MTISNNESSPTESAGASVISSVVMIDDGVVRGRFRAVCVSPVEEYRSLYVSLRDQMWAAEMDGRVDRVAKLQKTLLEIPTYERWSEEFPNVVTTVGKNDILDKYWRGSSYTQTVVMGLKGTGVAVAADTQASHASWLEVGLANAPTYTGNRKAVTLGAASAGVSTSAAQAFAITSTGTVAGCFMNNGGSATKDDTTGVLVSAGDFANSRSLFNGDTLNVTYSFTLT